MLFKLLSILMITMFGIAIVVQFNDPDPIFWVALYGLALLISVGALIDLPMPGVLWLVLGVYLAAAAWLSPNFANTSLEAFAAVGMKGLEEELVRELWGMVICAIWTGILVIREGKKNDYYDDTESKITDSTDEHLCKQKN